MSWIPSADKKLKYISHCEVAVVILSMQEHFTKVWHQSQWFGLTLMLRKCKLVNRQT